jgi:hypothetical protein
MMAGAKKANAIGTPIFLIGNPRLNEGETMNIAAFLG